MKKDKARIKEELVNAGYAIVKEERTGNDMGDKLTLSNDAIINCFDTGNFNVQGKNAEPIKAILIQPAAVLTPVNKKVFVVYGHDHNARTQLEAMLRRWDLEPIIIDQLASSGQTIIEKLEEYINQVSFGIVLATPDDIGYAKDNPDSKKHRVRQNVVLELGMLLSKLGRDKVAILLSQTEDMENPSDIQGLLYIPFKDTVDDGNLKLSLVKEMSKCGYIIPTAQL
jgi:predicted nucleotide-binding protein